MKDVSRIRYAQICAKVTELFLCLKWQSIFPLRGLAINVIRLYWTKKMCFFATCTRFGEYCTFFNIESGNNLYIFYRHRI
jgi:hypothetical protein